VNSSISSESVMGCDMNRIQQVWARA
jgi:hypothetical protein